MVAPNIVKEAGIPDWAGRLVLQLQKAFGLVANADFTNVSPSIAYAGILDIRDFGGKADWNGTTGTDNLPALIKAMAYINSMAPSAAYAAGARIRYPAAANGYWHSGTVFFKKNVIIEGDSPGQIVGWNAYASKLVFPANLGGPAFKFEAYNTYNNTIISPTTTGSDGSTVRNIYLLGAGSPSYDGVSHGIDTRVRISLEGVTVQNFGGNGYNIVANSSGTGPTQGNANEWAMTGCTAFGNKGHARLIQGIDVNAGTSIGFSVASSGLGGDIDLSFLGSNSHIGTNINSCGSSSASGFVSYSGNNYALVSATAGIGASTTPGTNDNIWRLLGAGSSYPTWSASGTYYTCCAILGGGGVSTSVYMAPYVETGYISNIQPPAMAIGGQGINTPGSATMFTQGGLGNWISNFNGFGALGEPPQDSSLGAYQVNWVGPTGYNMQNAAGGSFFIQWKTSDPFDIDMYCFGVANGVIFTTTGTSTTFGQSAGVPGVLNPQILAIGAGADARILHNVTAAEYAAWNKYTAQGERFLILDAAPAGTWGYQCTTAGTNPTGPGTGTAVLKAMGTLAP
jgi:hypothetical protein